MFHPFFSIDGRPLYSTDSQACPVTPRQEAYPGAGSWRLPGEKDYRKTVLLNDSRRDLHVFDREQSAVQV